MIDQSAFKLFLRDILKHGDLAKLANHFGVSEAAISQRLNANSEVPCNLYRGLKEAEAICLVNPDAGAKLKAFIDDLFDTWLNPATNRKPDLVLSDIAQDEADLLTARFKHLPIHEQRSRAIRLQEAACRFVESLGADNVAPLRA